MDEILFKYADILKERKNFGDNSELGTIVKMLSELANGGYDISVLGG